MPRNDQSRLICNALIEQPVPVRFEEASSVDFKQTQWIKISGHFF